MPGTFRPICDCDAEFRRLPGKHGLNACETQFEANDIALALMHRDEAEAGEHEREYKGQVVVVVHRTQQHRECHQAENEADAGWKYVDAAGS